MFKRGFKKDKISAQCEKAKAKDREALLVQNKENKVNSDVVPLVLDFHPAFSNRPMLQASDDFKKIFRDKKPLISFRRPRNLADNSVRSKVKRFSDKGKGMKKCGKARCQICNCVEETESWCMVNMITG